MAHPARQAATRVSLFFSMLCAAALPALAQTDVAGGRDHPLVPRMPAYYIADYKATDFDKVDLPIAGNRKQSVEGKHWDIRYAVKSGAPQSSAVDLLRNYQNAFLRKGGTVLMKDDSQATLHMKIPTGELWCHLVVVNAGKAYELQIVEKSGSNQQAAVNAGDLARALDEKGSVTLHNILFDTGRATIRPESSNALAVVGDLLENNETLKVDIQDHTDNTSAKDLNLTLSQNRALAIRDYLIKTFGIDGDRLTFTGLGDTKPIADNSTEEGRAQNRRVELVKLPDANTTSKTGRARGAGSPDAFVIGPGEWSGRVITGLTAIGGETTGIVLAVDQDRLELQANDPALQQKLRDLNGKNVTVRGSLEIRRGVEVRSRHIVTVTAVVTQ